MAWNGAGVWNRIYSWANDALAGLTISSARMDDEFANVKGGLENCVTRSGENQPLANLPMGTFRHTAVGTASARDQYAQVGQIQDTGYVWGGTAGGTANALTINLTPAITAYVAGQAFNFQVGIVNTGAATLAVNGLAATAIVKESGAALASGDMPVGAVVEVIHNGTNFRLGRTTATSLTTLAVDANVVHTTGNETIAGVKTFTTAIPLILSGSSPKVEGRNTTVGVTGYWRMHLPDTDNVFYLLRNTAGAGDFSTNSILMQLNSGGAATFLGTATASAATVSTELVTKGQLDAKAYGGHIANNGTASVTYGPTGWTVLRNAAGQVTVTHNFGTTNYSVALTVNGAAASIINLGAKAVNTFSVNTWSFAGALTDLDFQFVVARN